MLFGFDCQTATIIFNQIAAVKAAEKYNQAKKRKSRTCYGYAVPKRIGQGKRYP